MHLNRLSAQWQPFCLGLSVLMTTRQYIINEAWYFQMAYLCQSICNYNSDLPLLVSAVGHSCMRRHATIRHDIMTQTLTCSHLQSHWTIKMMLASLLWFQSIYLSFLVHRDSHQSDPGRLCQHYDGNPFLEADHDGECPCELFLF